MATPEPPDFAEVPPPPSYTPDPMKYVPSAAIPDASLNTGGKFMTTEGFKGPRVSVSRTEGGTTVVTRDCESAKSYFHHVEIKQVNNGWELLRGRDGYPDRYDWDAWVFASKADLAKFIVDKF